MKNKILVFAKKYLWHILIIVVLSGLAINFAVAQISARKYSQTCFLIRVSPAIQDDKLKTARLVLEESVFQSVNNLIAQNAKLTYSEALDHVLPISKSVVNLPDGVEIIVLNNGSTTVHNLQVSVTLGVPFKNYKVFSNESFSVVEEDASKGILKINAERLTQKNQISINVLLSGERTVFLTASRTENNLHPILQPTLTSESVFAKGIQMLEIMATQTATAIDNRNNFGLLQFHFENRVDNINSTIFVSSNEVQGCFYPERMQEGSIQERDSFFKIFQQ